LAGHDGLNAESEEGFMTPARQMNFWVVILIAAFSLQAPWICSAEPRKPCLVVKSYVMQIVEIAMYKFGEEREKELAAAQAKLQVELKQLNYVMSEELNALLSRYVNATTLGYDRLRRGNATLLAKARELENEIKRLCPWE
jgi:hypothetical protein